MLFRQGQLDFNNDTSQQSYVYEKNRGQYEV